MKRVLIVLALVLSIVGAPRPVAAARGAEHCVVSVIGARPSGELVVSSPECYASFAEAMEGAGVDAWGEGAAAQLPSSLATFTIGTHYENAGFSGASMSVVGSDCTGGWLNVTSVWNNRISSTRHGCPHIRHFSGYNLTGTSQLTATPGANLTTLNNLTSSIQYLA